MKKGKYLPLYYEWIRKMELPHNGLCNCFGTSLTEHRWIPDRGFADFKIMFPDDGLLGYWGYGDGNGEKEPTLFTSLRQTIVLLMAATNNEL